VLEDSDGPGEGELPLLEAVGHINEEDYDEEHVEGFRVVHDDEDVPFDLLQPIDQTEGAEYLGDVLNGLWGLPGLPELKRLLQSTLTDSSKEKESIYTRSTK
jgi:hypothetical protein